jgi:hypothetical protein
MLFKILKLFGLDVRAEIAAVKGQIEQRIDDIADHAKHLALSTAVIIALSTFAGLFCTMAIGVGLIMLYRAEAETYGVDTALAIVGAALVAAAVILLVVALMVGRSLSRKRASSAPDDAAKSAAVAARAQVASGSQAPSEAIAPPTVESAADLTEPLSAPLALFAKNPKLGHPILDEIVGILHTPAGGKADEAVEQALNLLRNGDRTQILVMLGGAALAGWLLARSRPGTAPRDAIPPI